MSSTRAIRIAVYDAKPCDEEFFSVAVKDVALNSPVELVYISDRLDISSVDKLSTAPQPFDAVCIFTSSDASGPVVRKIKEAGVNLILIRCAGFDMVDLKVCDELGISVVRVPAYSPFAVAEFAWALLLTLNRKTHKAYNRVRDSNMSLNGLVGSDIHGKTVGIIGTGKIGQCFADIALGFGCNILAYDIFPSTKLQANPKVTYTTLEDIFRHSDFISLHTILSKDTVHLINAKTLSLMKPTALLVNVSRGALVDSEALIDALVNGTIRGAAMDVYENEHEYVFRDCSDKVMRDPILARLQNMANFILTPHMAFLTEEALDAITKTTLQNCQEYFDQGKRLTQLTNQVPYTPLPAGQ